MEKQETESSSDKACINTLELDEVNYVERKEADLRNIWDSLKNRTLNPEFPGDQKYPRKIQGIVMGWKKILSLKDKNWIDDERKVERQRETDYLDWLYRVETFIGDEERELVESSEDLIYIDTLSK